MFHKVKFFPKSENSYSRHKDGNTYEQEYGFNFPKSPKTLNNVRFEQKTPLMIACERIKPNLGEIIKLLQTGVNPNEFTFDKKTALHFAAITGHPECIQLLVNAGANINAIDKFGKTPLHYAALCNKAIVKLLLLGANPNITDSTHHTPLAIALQSEEQMTKSYASVLVPLFEVTDVTRILENCVAHPLDANQRKTLALLAKKGVEMHAIGEQKRTPIMTAAQAGDIALLDILLALPPERRAHVNEANRPSLWTALHLASRYGHSACVAKLLAAGASTRAATEHGWTPLQKAAEHGHLQTCIELVKGGADIYEPNGCERDLIASNFALRHFHQETFKFLFQIMDEDRQRQFVINLIKSRYDYEKIFTLLDWGLVDIDMNYNGESLLTAAIACLDSKGEIQTWTLSLIERLLKYSPNLNPVSYSPPCSPCSPWSSHLYNPPQQRGEIVKSPMALAYERNDLELEELLLKYGATPYIQPGYQIFQGLEFNLSDILNDIIDC